MVISLITALTTQGIIGRDNTLPWHLPKDLKHFKSLTQGKAIIMGRKTFASIGKPLPNRHNIVITRDLTFSANGCTIVHSLKQALEIASDTTEEVFIIGGAEIYRQALPLADFMYLTLIHADIPGNIHFPIYNKNEWTEISREEMEPDQQNAHPLSFIVLKRNMV